MTGKRELIKIQRELETYIELTIQSRLQKKELNQIELFLIE